MNLREGQGRNRGRSRRRCRRRGPPCRTDRTSPPEASTANSCRLRRSSFYVGMSLSLSLFSISFCHCLCDRKEEEYYTMLSANQLQYSLTM